MFTRPLSFALALTLPLAGCVGLAGDGDRAAETRTVSVFTTVDVNNGLELTLTIDPSATGDVDLEVSAESNLIDYISTTVAEGALTADTTEDLRPTLSMELSGVTADVSEADVNNGAVLVIDGLERASFRAQSDNGADLEASGAVEESVVVSDNGAMVNLSDLKATSAAVDINNGAFAILCVSGAVTGTVNNGATLVVECGGDSSGVSEKNGGVVQSN